MNVLQRILVEIFRWPIVTLWHLSGWRTTRDVPKGQLVITGAPHTSNWDYLLFLCALLEQRRRPYVTIKKEAFLPVIGAFLRFFGGIPIDRGRSANVVDQMAEMFAERENLILVVTPEGTRKYTDHWKSGFYYVAQKANVPILCGVPNWKEKRIYFDLMLEASGNIEADMEKIREYQERVGYGRYPERASKVALRQRDLARINRAQQQAIEEETAAEATSSN